MVVGGAVQDQSVLGNVLSHHILAGATKLICFRPTMEHRMPVHSRAQALHSKPADEPEVLNKLLLLITEVVLKPVLTLNSTVMRSSKYQIKTVAY